MDMQELLEEAADWIANDRDEIILCHTIDGDMATLDPEAQQKQEPYCIVYEFDTWAGLHRSTSAKPYNGARPDRAVKVYTATQPAAPADRKPAARVNEDGFLVECGDLPLAPGSVLYLGQPAAPLVPLTNEQIARIYETSELAGTYFDSATDKAIAVARAIERAHGIGVAAPKVK